MICSVRAKNAIERKNTKFFILVSNPSKINVKQNQKNFSEKLGKIFQDIQICCISNVKLHLSVWFLSKESNLSNIQLFYFDNVSDTKSCKKKQISIIF